MSNQSGSSADAMTDEYAMEDVTPLPSRKRKADENAMEEVTVEAASRATWHSFSTYQCPLCPEICTGLGTNWLHTLSKGRPPCHGGVYERAYGQVTGFFTGGRRGSDLCLPALRITDLSRSTSNDGVVRLLHQLPLLSKRKLLLRTFPEAYGLHEMRRAVVLVIIVVCKP